MLLTPINPQMWANEVFVAAGTNLRREKVLGFGGGSSLPCADRTGRGQTGDKLGDQAAFWEEKPPLKAVKVQGGEAAALSLPVSLIPPTHWQQPPHEHFLFPQRARVTIPGTTQRLPLNGWEAAR